MSKSRLSRKAIKKPYSLDQCALYKLHSKRRLAELLGSSVAELSYLSADKGNYSVFEIPKCVCEFTGKEKKARWVQNPSTRLKAVHQRVQRLLSRVAVPAYCHGGTKGKSYKSNAEAHVNAPAIATFDLKSFFPSTTSKQVFGFFQNSLLCSADVAGLLADLCTYDRALPTGSALCRLVWNLTSPALMHEPC